MRSMTLVCWSLALTIAACGSPTSPVENAPDGSNRNPGDLVDAAPADLLVLPDQPRTDEIALDFASPDTLPDTVEPQCAPGEGCFLDPCIENDQCQSGWCVDHMGEGVCSKPCTEECPAGWTCQQVAGTDPDLVYVCVSQVANLCKPCATNADCKSVGGAEDLCLTYGAEGSFCGGSCTTNDDCPWGFSCLEAETVNGIGTSQCIADSGTCPCTSKSIALSLSTPCENENEFGTCLGQRVCTDAGLTDCDAPVPESETCDGLDNDCDQETDEPTLVAGEYVALCDDENPCTDDSCAGLEGCVNEAMTEGECSDGDPCTAADHCEAGVCIGSPVECEDNNACTDDFCTDTGGCEHLPAAGECDDGDPCTLGDHCSNGSCIGEAVGCDCQKDADCDPLEDGDLCNGTLVCNLNEVPYQCEVAAESVVECPAAQGVNAPCQEPSCNPQTGACSLIPAHDQAPCDDGNPCTVGDTCQVGTCTGGAAPNCNDGNPCTDDSCDPATGCTNVANEAACSDDDICTVGDHCANAFCVSGSDSLDCDDGNPCTDDLCQPEQGCLHSANANPCDDGDACTLNDHCVAGQCVSDATSLCNDNNPCTTDSCDPEQGCLYALNDLPCDDGSVCTIGDHCHLGECIPAQNLDCDDGNSCTDDTCLPATGCQHTNNSLPCDDENACTLGDTCTDGWCKAAGMLNCDDDNPCTDDACDPNQGCVHANNVALCDDANACTVGDTCQDGQCQPGGQAQNCDDGNPCTDDSCSAQDGCIHVNSVGPCDDANACTVGDTCLGGVCVPGADPLPCDDGNPCTDDSCSPAQGCLHANNTAPCDDGNACTPSDVCAAGTCVGSGELTCDDGNPCTTDSCSAQVGCQYEAITPCCGNGAVEAGEECDDGNHVDGDGCSAACLAEGACVKLGVDVRTLEQPPENYQLGYCQTLCEDSQTTIPQGWHIATIAEVAFLKDHVKFGACGVYGICGSYWYGGDMLTANCNSLQYNCTTGGCWALTTHCYTQVMLIKDGKDGTCLQ